MGLFLRHIGCEECGSSDANALYDEGEGKTSSHCFSCGKSRQNINKPDFVFGETKEKELEEEIRMTVEMINSLPLGKGIKDRGGIRKDIVEFYRMRVSRKGQDESVTHHYYPYTLDGRVIGYQERELVTKEFRSIGKGKAGMDLQGQDLFPAGGKYLVITEGFLDTLAASQMLEGEKGVRYPVVSLPGGASNLKAVANNLKWINSFSKVVLMLDQDDSGTEAATKIAKMCKPGIVSICKFSEKDACDMLVADKVREFQRSFWDTPKWRPAGIVTGEDVEAILSTENEVPSIPYPDFATKLNMDWYGKRRGEITLFTAGTGSGKSQFLKEDMYHMLNNFPDVKIGIVSLEESTREILTGLKSLFLDKRVHLPDVVTSEEEDKEYIEWMKSQIGERIVMLDHQGSSADDDLLDDIRYLIALGCNYIYIDHITIAVSESNDTNKAIDTFMSDLLKMAKRNLVWFGVVSHLRKTSGDRTSFENGAVPTDDDLKGSGSIKQIAFDIIALCRNKMAKDEKVRNTTKIYVLKSRYTGRTGFAGKFTYQSGTGRLIEADVSPDDEEMEDFT